MGQTIQLLPEDLCNKIAAGEVIQRPASVIKELIENSIDAGADDIQIFLSRGGRDDIRISDNGSGMSGDNLLMAFERHATSKIRTFSDLDSIRSMGFRGEALASIAGVARVECSTATQDGEGNRIRIDGGKVIDYSPVSSTRGSIFSVRSLFYTVPARKKFLKDEQIEYRYCLDIIRRFALIQTNIRFSLEHNGKVIFKLTGNKIEDRIAKLYGEKLSNQLIPVNFDSGDLKIDGFLGHPELSRNRGNEQLVYVNQRVIMDRRLNATVYSAYSHYLERGQYPFFLLNINIPPSEIDINVHPAKTEIKFRRDYAIMETLKNTVKIELKRALQIEVPDSFDTNSINIVSNRDPINNQWTPSGNMPKAKPSQLNIQNETPSSHSKLAEMNLMDLDKRMALLDSSLEAEKQQQKHKPEFRLWQAHNRYIFAEISSGIIIVDQHLAHTRVLYDISIKALNENNNKSNAQQLLFPITLELNPLDWSRFLEIIPSLKKLGFGLRIFGKNTLAIDAVPIEARTVDEGSLLLTILNEFNTLNSNNNPLHHSLALAFSEKAAIRKGDKLDETEMQSLIDTLFSSENPYYCPRGKAIIFNISNKELAGKFS